jgi:hypothetical protein
MWLCSSSTPIIEDRDSSTHLNILTTRDLPGVLHSLQAAQHVLEMFRRSLPNGGDRRILDRLMNRHTKILSRVQKLDPSEK